ncbi:MAG: phosphoribosylformimino-5-aminoimidazole carboxamide ribotide isomerase [Lachnospiraceae bacterium]|nr:phosphoribosylformimino-5-aminoimidazole carboxamide ribotide isomerase [Lachnospiraceae bacterium]
MEFRPCIDIHNGKVKQIVGGSLRDEGDTAEENFVSEQDAAFYAQLYQRFQIRGGHVILLNAKDSPFYAETKSQALSALRAAPDTLQVGGGITPENAREFLDAGATHVIVTSWVFRDGVLNYGNLEKICAVSGRERLVLDLSCRKRDGAYYVVTDRWQKFTDEVISEALLDRLAGYADEFLIHAADVEGKASGIERGLVEMLGGWNRIPVTYAGGVGSFEHLRQLREWGRDRLNVTIGSALDLFGGDMPFGDVLAFLSSDPADS